MSTYDICNLGDGMMWAHYYHGYDGTVDPSKVPLECLALYIANQVETVPFILRIASSKSNIYLDLYDEFMSRFSARTIRCHCSESSKALHLDASFLSSFTVSSYGTKTLMSKLRYAAITSSDTDDALNEALKNLQYLDAHIQKYYNKVVTLHDAMESMIGSSASLDDWVNERGYQISSATVNESTAQSVSHPLDASDIDSGIVDDSTKNNYSSTYDAKSSSRDSNLISQFKTLWNNWVDVKNQILDECEPWFVNTFSAW